MDIQKNDRLDPIELAKLSRYGLVKEIRSQQSIISQQTAEIERLTQALIDQKSRMEDGQRNGYESETVFWTRCIWEIDQAVLTTIQGVENT